MTKCLAFFFLFLTPTFALPEGSPTRCKKEDWAHVDNLLPDRSKEGGYPQPLDPAKQKLGEVTPGEMLQSVVDHLLTFYDLCGVPVAGRGGWEDAIGTDLCERLALYNLLHNEVLTEPIDGQKEYGRLMFALEDLSFLQSVFKACRPTSQRWWNYPLIQHVSFNPTPEEYKELGKTLRALK